MPGNDPSIKQDLIRDWSNFGRMIQRRNFFDATARSLGVRTRSLCTTANLVKTIVLVIVVTLLANALSPLESVSGSARQLVSSKSSTTVALPPEVPLVEPPAPPAPPSPPPPPAVKAPAPPPPPPPPPPGPPPASPSYWPGWSGIEHMVVFGDSMTTTRFNPFKELPSESNPLGNPPFPGTTSAGGPNWVSFLTGTYNATFLKTVNLAFGGAVVDGDAIHQLMAAVKSFKDQVYKHFLPVFVPPPRGFNWKSRNTLFAVFMGTNDVNIAYRDDQIPALPQSRRSYSDLLDVLYQNGARNFLLLNAVPLDRGPLINKFGKESMLEEGLLLNEFNRNLTEMAANLSSTYPDAKAMVFDTNSLFLQLLEDPCSYEETCNLHNLTDMCGRYKKGPEDWYHFEEECVYPVNEYFWVNTVHPSWTVHNATAKAIAAWLSEPR